MLTWNIHWESHLGHIIYLTKSKVIENIWSMAGYSGIKLGVNNKMVDAQSQNIWWWNNSSI